MAGYFGLTLEQLANRDYTHTQRVSAQVYVMLDVDNVPLFEKFEYLPPQTNFK